MDKLVLLILGLTINWQVIPLAFACFGGGGSSKTTPAPPTTRSPDTMRCTPNEKICLHGGTCIVQIVGGNRVISCQCPEGWIGDECEVKKPDLLVMSSATTPGAIAGIVIAVVLVFLLIAAIFFLALRKKRKSDKPKLHDPYTFSPSNKDDVTRTKTDNFAVSRHMYNTKTLNPNYHVTSLPPQHPGHRNKAFDSSPPSKQTTKKTDIPDNSRINSILSNTSRTPSNTGSVFHHNTSTLSSASNCPVAHHESTV